MNKYSSENPERIRWWILENVHLVWDAVKKLQSPELKGFCLRVTFSKESWPIVRQWHSAKDQKSDSFVSEELWYIDSNFSNIGAFADWVRNVQMTVEN